MLKSLEEQHILVTGAAGFIGSHLVDALVEHGCSVVGIDNFEANYPRKFKERALRQALRSERFRLFTLDVCDRDSLREIFEREGPFDAVVHLAARVGVRQSLQEPLEYQRVNVRGTLVLLELAVSQARRPRVVFSSSSSVYGDVQSRPVRESLGTELPISPYAASKRACELDLHSYHKCYGLDVACLRLFTVYGPRQRPDLAIARFVRSVFAGEPIQMFGDGSSSRDYTYVGDIVNGFLSALCRCTGFELINLGSGSPVTLKEMIEVVESACGQRAVIVSCPEQPGDVRHTFADTSKAAKLLDYRPMVGFGEGVSRYVRWLNNQ